MLTVAFGECVAVLAQTMSDEPGIEVIAVADDQGAHAATVPTLRAREAGGRAPLRSGDGELGGESSSLPARRTD